MTRSCGARLFTLHGTPLLPHGVETMFLLLPLRRRRFGGHEKRPRDNKDAPPAVFDLGVAYNKQHAHGNGCPGSDTPHKPAGSILPVGTRITSRPKTLRNPSGTEAIPVHTFTLAACFSGVGAHPATTGSREHQQL